jgi:UDP-2,4-diacetamido-2,4,6-trideoxy-beta-L-altropyranose hydrolase
MLLGPAYALLRPAFYRPGIARERSGEVRKLLVTFGAGDPTGQTAKIAEALLSLPEGRLHTDILADPSAVPSAIVGAVEARRDIRLLGWVSDPVPLMQAADLAFGAGGITAWERCTLGLPALVITTADNQRPSMTALSAAGAIQLLGAADSVTVDDIKRALLQLLNDSQRVAAMSRRALAVGVGSGPASAADAMEALR